MKHLDEAIQQDLSILINRLDREIEYSSTIVEMMNLPTEDEQLKFVYALFHSDYDCYRNVLNSFSTQL